MSMLVKTQNKESWQEKTKVRLPGSSKFCSWVSENRSSVARWASEISLSSLVSLNKNVSLINDDFQSEAISKLKTARSVVNHWVESMDKLGIQAYFVRVCPLISILADTASKI